MGDVSGRIGLTHRIVRNISWFFDNAYSELPVPHRDAFGWGQVGTFIVFFIIVIVVDNVST